MISGGVSPSEIDNSQAYIVAADEYRVESMPHRSGTAWQGWVSIDDDTPSWAELRFIVYAICVTASCHDVTVQQFLLEVVMAPSSRRFHARSRNAARSSA